MDKDRPIFSFFSLKDAVRDVSNASGAGETAAASAKLVGKTLFNTGIIAGKIGAKIIQDLPDTLARNAEKQLKDNPQISGERRERMESYVKRNRK